MAKRLTEWTGEELLDCDELDEAAFRAKWGDRRTHDAFRVKRQHIRRGDTLQPAQRRMLDEARARRDAGLPVAPEPAPGPPAEDPILAQRRKMAELALARQRHRAVEAEAELAEALDCLGESLQRLPVIAPVAAPALGGRAVSADEELILVYSDGHCGARVDGQALGGLGGFDEAIWQERHDRLRLAVAEAQRTFRVGRLNIFNLGDNVEGQNMRPSQAYEIDRYLTDQVAIAAQRKALDAAYYATLFARVDEFGVGGNHARIGHKGDAPYAANWDRLIYWAADQFVRDYPNVTWHLPKAWFQVVQRGRTTFVLVHGDDVKSWLGIPFYGMQRARMRYQQALGIAFDFVVVGHHHQPFKDDYIIANGSMVGATEYTAKQLVAANLPSQKLILLDRKEGITWVQDVPLARWDEIRRVPVYDE